MWNMEDPKVEESTYDIKFRKIVTDLIRMARDEILIATGEFSIYYYPDVRNVLRETWLRDIPVKAYLGRCDEDTIYRAVANGITVYQGKDPPKEHFMVVDRKHWIVSEDHEPYEPGKRHGSYKINDEKVASDKVRYFDSLIKSKDSKLISKIKRDPERIDKFLAEIYE